MIRRILDRIARAAFVRDAVAVSKAALGIESPSLAFLDAFREAERRPHEPRANYVAPPWFAARGPRERWESPELAAAARRVRRLIRRHWWALAFEPESPIALSVLEAIATPPERPESPSLLDAVQQLEALGAVPRLDPDFARELAEQCGVRWERAEVYVVAADGFNLAVPRMKLPADVVVVPAEQCPNCVHVATECQCGDLRDCW